MSRVFVVQNPHRLDRETQTLKPVFDLTPAEEYGELHYLLSPSASPFSPETILPELIAKLEDFQDDDHLLLIGSPILIGWAVAVAADWNNGRVSCLQWNGRDRRYVRVAADISVPQDVEGDAA